LKKIEERTIDSRFHFRLDKQELIKGKLIIQYTKNNNKNKNYTLQFTTKIDTIKNNLQKFLQTVN
jgi:hypothetical protein